MDSVTFTVQGVVRWLLSFEIDLSPVPVGMKVLRRDLIHPCFAEVVQGVGCYIINGPILGFCFLVSVATGLLPVIESVPERVPLDRAANFDVVIQLVIEIHRQSDGFIPI